ncbi:hypothetical protein BU14_0023s0022 [Porphyra umbilicalis]|uniref:Uncharacterized protein n=1 Tax=Porphyra umbilicalis TaxID=2786 RepID=A0A1X6PK38_PORUM|nr:hypothetical protein BU14_0023s0022 [Porphyra umbilicalis]|eukprot:OSX81217.1 hypothetical protein BU14_0023s0022 [Porphyra umbilicalis]
MYAFVGTSAAALSPARTAPAVCVSSFAGARLASAPAVRPARMVMGLGEDGLAEDLSAAKDCIDEGCEINAVQDILSRLDSRKTTLMREVTEINVVMAALAKANVGNDRGMVSEAMEAAVRIFSKVDDMYPKVGSPSPWTMDKQKKKNKGKF